MELTKVQRKLLESLAEESKEINEGELHDKYSINPSDSIREGLLFSEGGYVELRKRDYIGVNYSSEAENLGDLPEFVLLNILRSECMIITESLEDRILTEDDLRSAVSELRNLGLISLEDKVSTREEIKRFGFVKFGDRILTSSYLGSAVSELRKLELVRLRKNKDKKLVVEYVDNGEKFKLERRNQIFRNIGTNNVLYKDSEEFEHIFSELKDLEKRRLIKIKERSSYYLRIKDEGRELLREGHEDKVTLLTPQMIKDGSWENVAFKEYDASVESKKLVSGRLHPLRQLALKVERIFRDMGYEFMVGGLVVDSFRNFDALFTPQDHPARELQDTFYLEYPQYCGELDGELVEGVRKTHEQSFKYKWDCMVARKNILRTHTTAVTARYLEEKSEVPLKLFSIGRVFRNEKIDAMHLPEFHQIEGVVVGDVNLRDLMGHISAFYKRIGLEGISFKKTFNPYTEPSMEIYAYHPALRRQIEVGNSGMFRPEMLAQFDFGNQRAIAWGLALERLASIIYNRPKIKDLIGADVDIDWLRGESKLWL